jgi:diaminopimelate decarboxylase
MSAPAPVLTTDDPSVAELVAARSHLSLHAMDGLLMEEVPLSAIADAVGTPCWVYSAGAMRARLAALSAALSGAGLDAHIHYAVKANDHLAVLRVFAAGGAGADVVSEGELCRALLAGIPGADIVFSGVGKTARELEAALSEDIGQINVESAEELEMLSAVATRTGRVARVALRVNPDVDAGTHHKISTGRAGDKFGIPYADAVELYGRAAALPGIQPVGIALHIGSQIMSAAPYRAAYARAAELVRALRACGQRVEVVDCGGGLGVGYRDQPDATPDAFAGAVKATLGSLDVRLMIEPGRWLVAPCGVLLAGVVLVKQAVPHRIVVLDAAMNDLIRPAMYDAWHGIVPLSAVDAVQPASAAQIVGPVCETGDTFARNRLLPPVAAGARVAILDAGAYGAVMSSTYNARPLAAQVMIDGSRWEVIRPRQPHAALWEAERVPAFLACDHSGGATQSGQRSG